MSQKKDYDKDYIIRALETYGSNRDSTSTVDVYSVYNGDQMLMESIHATNKLFKVATSFEKSSLVLDKSSLPSPCSDSRSFYGSFDASHGPDSTITVKGEYVTLTITHPLQRVSSYKYIFHGKMESDDLEPKILSVEDFPKEYESSPQNFIFDSEILDYAGEANASLFPVEKIGTLPSSLTTLGNFFDKYHISSPQNAKCLSIKAISDTRNKSTEFSNRQFHNKTLKAIEVVSRRNLPSSILCNATLLTKKNVMLTVQVQTKNQYFPDSKKECLIAPSDDPMGRVFYISQKSMWNDTNKVSTFIFEIMCLECKKFDPMPNVVFFTGSITTSHDEEEPLFRSRMLTPFLNDVDKDKINGILAKNLVAVHLELASGISKKLSMPINVFTIQDPSKFTPETVEVDNKKYRLLKNSAGSYYFLSDTFTKTFIGVYKSCQTFIDYCNNPKLTLKNDDVYYFD